MCHATGPAWDEVHVWNASLDVPAEMTAYYWSVLSDDERTRAERFRFREHHRRFVVSHGVLRSLLGHYIGQCPRSLEFTFSRHGKPELKEDGELRFNMAHSRDVAVFVLARDRRVGVDAEWMDPATDVLTIASRVFSSTENAAIRALPAELQTTAFYRCWTRKEAYIKGRGDGLSLDLRTFTMSVHAGHAALLETLCDPEEARRWTMGTFEPDACYAGAFAVEGTFGQALLFEWEHEQLMGICDQDL
jgi:4'-phosphopantetheinyl transferase